MKHKYLKQNFLLVVILFIFFQLNAQNSYKAWFGVSYEQKIKINKFKFKTKFSEQLRISDLLYNTNISALTEVGVSKKISKFYKLGLSYRVSYFNLKHRIALSNTFKINLKPITISFRLKYQAEFKNNVAFSQDFRGKTSVKFDLHKDYRPYLFAEILYNDTYNYSNFNEYRLGIALDADFKKKHNFDIMFMFVKEINFEEPKTSAVIGISYGFSK